MVQQIISISPEDAIEGGAIPVDRNLRIKDARFMVWDYQGKAPPTTAARITLVDDESGEFTQYYSAAQPNKFVASQDGKTLIPVGTDDKLVVSSNFMILMTNLVSAGFPEPKLKPGDISVLNDLYAYWTGIPAPKRIGLKQLPGQQADDRERIILVPKTILALPGQKAKKGKAAAPVTATASAPVTAAAPAAAAVESDSETDVVMQQAVDFVKKTVAEQGTVTRTMLATRVFRDLISDPNRDQISALIFSPELQGALLASGLKVQGENVSQ